MSQSTLDIIIECDNFPYPDQEEAYAKLLDTYYVFSVLKEWKPDCHEYINCGYVTQWVADGMPWTEQFHIDHDKRRISIKYSEGSNIETLAIANQLTLARDNDSFQLLRGWRNEVYPIFGAGRDIRIERAGSSLFGILTAGAHMTGYVKTADGQIKIWVPQRSKSKSTYPGLLDNTVAGGIAAGEDQFECMVREAGEEASLPEHFVRRNLQPCGCVSYFYLRDERAGGESGLPQPETQYVYDLELPEDLIPKPSDNEVEAFYLYTIDEVKNALAERRFKPNCALVLIEFLIRHGKITATNEPNYWEIIQRVHRRLRF